MNGRLTRRQFIKRILAGLGMGVASSLLGCFEAPERAEPTKAPALPAPEATATPTAEATPAPTPVKLREAMFYRPQDGTLVQCQICFRRCGIPDGQVGFCRNRKNIGGKLYSLVYGRPCALQVDPIEKEPAFHMLPGGTILCTGTASCNQRCKFCQNWEMSQKAVWELWNYDASPEEVVALALREGCDAVSFTYNEPTVFYEYMLDIATLAKEKGLRALFHTNGTLNPEPLFTLLEIMDAVTVDLKAFTPEFYRRISSSRLEPVLRTLENIRKTDAHLEIVNLIIPTLNDNMDDIRRMCAWIKENLGEETPLHFTRFFPAYKLRRLPPTPIETLEEAAQVADAEGLRYVYIGNVPGHERNSTFCPACGKRIIHRVHFTVLSLDVVEGRCRFCGHEIPGIWWN